MLTVHNNGCGLLNIGRADEDDLILVICGAFAEGQYGGLAQLVNGRCGVEILFARLPGEANDYLIVAGVDGGLVVGDTEVDQTVVDGLFCSLKLIFRHILVGFGGENGLYSSLNVDTPTDIACALEINLLIVAVVAFDSEEGDGGQGYDKGENNEE